jgi:hypothetical protein
MKVTYPDCPVCGSTVAHADREHIIHVVPGPGGYDHRVPSVPVGYTFEPCAHRIVDQESVEAYTAACKELLRTLPLRVLPGATFNADNLTP